jgi:predicted aspartyl protease
MLARGAAPDLRNARGLSLFDQRNETDKRLGRSIDAHMGAFHIGCTVENHIYRSKSARIRKLLVDTGSEHTWLPANTLEKIGVVREKKDISFVMANGQVVTRSVGFAILRVDEHFTIDEVVFAERGDLLLLGARTLEGLNLVVDAVKKKLVAAGPIPAA